MHHFTVFVFALFSFYGCAHTEYLGEGRLNTEEAHLLTEFQTRYPGQFRVADSSTEVCAALVSGSATAPAPTRAVIFFATTKNVGNLLAALNIGMHLPSKWRYVVWLMPEKNATDAQRHEWKRSYSSFIEINTIEEYRRPTTGDMGAVAVLKLDTELSRETCPSPFLIGPLYKGDYGKIFYGGTMGVIRFKEELLYR